MELTQWPGWLVSKSRESSCPHLSSAGIIGAHCHSWDLFGCWLIAWLGCWFGLVWLCFMWVLGIQTEAFVLCNQLCMNWAISAAPDLLLTPGLKVAYHWYFCSSGNNDKIREIRECVTHFNQAVVTKIFTGGSSDYIFLAQLLPPSPRLSVIQLWLQPMHRRL